MYSQILLYNATNNSWSNDGTLTITRYDSPTVLLESGDVLMIGGYTGEDLNSLTFTSSVELYDSGKEFVDTSPLKDCPSREPSDDICIPVKSSNGKIALICL